MVGSAVIGGVAVAHDLFDLEIDALGVPFRELNQRIRLAAERGVKSIFVRRVYGQRYIGTRLNGLPSVRLEIFGTPGNDLGAFMDGHVILVHGNAQDGVGNTMHGGEIIVEGRAGDVLGMSMVAGSILVRDDAGYRAALHVKEYGRTIPSVVIGGTAQDFLGEYMAGGRLVVLGLGGRRHRMSFIGTGIHGGIIYMRGPLAREQLGEGAETAPLKSPDLSYLGAKIDRFEELFGLPEEVAPDQFTKVVPKGKRPYSSLYA